MAKSFRILMGRYDGLWSETDSLGQTPLFAAARHNQLQIFKAVPLSQALLNKQDEVAGHTILFYAVASKHFDLCIFLLRNGANPSAIDNCGNSLIDYTSLSKDQDIELKDVLTRFKVRAEKQNDLDKPKGENLLEGHPKKEDKSETQAYNIKALTERRAEMLSNQGIDELFARYKQI